MARQLRKTRRNAKARRGTRKGGKRNIVKRQRVMRKKSKCKSRRGGGRRKIVGGTLDNADRECIKEAIDAGFTKCKDIEDECSIVYCGQAA